MDYRNMDIGALNRVLLDRMNELARHGLVDNYFLQLHSFKADSGPSFLLDLISVFFSDAQTVVNEMSKILYQPGVDYNKLYSHYIKLKGSSACFGACRVTYVCSDLRHAIESKSKDGCFRAVQNIKYEYNFLCEQLESIIKIEQEIFFKVTGKR